MKKIMFTISNILTKKVKTKQNVKIDFLCYELEKKITLSTYRYPFRDLSIIAPIRDEMGELYFFITLDTLLNDHKKK